MKWMKLFLIVFCMALLLAACGEEPNVEATVAAALAATETAKPPTATPEPTATPISTDTPTPLPTATDTPTAVPPTDTPTPEPTATEIATAVPSISLEGFETAELENGWTQYTLPEDGISIALPPSWLAVRLDPEFMADAFGDVAAQNEGAFNMLSSEAVQAMMASGIKLMALDSDPDVLGLTTPTSLNILVLEMPIQLSTDVWLNLNEAQLAGLADEGTLEMEEVTVAGKAGAKFTYTAQIVNAFSQPDHVQLQQYLLLDGKTQYILTFAAQIDIAETYGELFAEIAETFEILSPE